MVEFLVDDPLLLDVPLDQFRHHRLDLVAAEFDFPSHPVDLVFIKMVVN